MFHVLCRLNWDIPSSLSCELGCSTFSVDWTGMFHVLCRLNWDAPGSLSFKLGSLSFAQRMSQVLCRESDNGLPDAHECLAVDEPWSYPSELSATSWAVSEQRITYFKYCILYNSWTLANIDRAAVSLLVNKTGNDEWRRLEMTTDVQIIDPRQWRRLQMTTDV